MKGTFAFYGLDKVNEEWTFSERKVIVTQDLPWVSFLAIPDEVFETVLREAARDPNFPTNTSYIWISLRTVWTYNTATYDSGQMKEVLLGNRKPSDLDRNMAPLRKTLTLKMSASKTFKLVIARILGKVGEVCGLKT